MVWKWARDFPIELNDEDTGVLIGLVEEGGEIYRLPLRLPANRVAGWDREIVRTNNQRKRHYILALLDRQGTNNSSGVTDVYRRRER